MFNGFNAASAAAAALLVILGAQWGNEASGRDRWKGKWGETVRGSHWRVPEYYETEAAAAAACADWRQ